MKREKDTFQRVFYIFLSCALLICLSSISLKKKNYIEYQGTKVEFSLLPKDKVRLHTDKKMNSYVELSRDGEHVQHIMWVFNNPAGYIPTYREATTEEEKIFRTIIQKKYTKYE